MQIEMNQRAMAAPGSPTSAMRQRSVNSHNRQAGDAGDRGSEDWDPAVTALIASCYDRFDLDGSGSLNSSEASLHAHLTTPPR